MITNEMKICAAKVRRCPCPKCLHFKECSASVACASRLGHYIAWLQETALPRIQSVLRVIMAYPFKIDARAPVDRDLKAYYAVACVMFNAPNMKGNITTYTFRVGLQGSEDIYEITNLILEAYSKAVRKYHGTK